MLGARLAMSGPHDLFARYTFDDAEAPEPEAAPGIKWACREDPFSSYRAGFEVRTAADADTALAIATDWLPDVVIADFLLRGGPNGAELCRWLHADPRTGHIPTLVMTGSTRKADAEAILGAGCADLRTKPYLPDALVTDVRRLAAVSLAAGPLPSAACASSGRAPG